MLRENEIAASGGASRVQSIDSLRGLAAFAVMFYHFSYTSPLFKSDSGFSRLMRAVGYQGQLGVPVFFVISGFVLPYSLDASGYKWGYFKAFVAKRLLRLEPTYLFSLATHLGLWALASRLPSFRGEPLEIEPGRLLSHFGYLSDILGYRWYSENYWTLGIEFQFYIAMALTKPLLFGTVSWWRWLGVSGLIVADLAHVPRSLFMSHGALFALGIQAFTLRSKARRTPADVGLAVATVATLFRMHGIASAIAATVAAVVIFFDSLPRWRPIVWLGTISYALYLFHTIIGERFLHIAARFAQTDASRCVVMIASIVVSLVTAWVVCLAVEWPSQRMASRIHYNART